MQFETLTKDDLALIESRVALNKGYSHPNEALNDIAMLLGFIYKLQDDTQTAVMVLDSALLKDYNYQKKITKLERALENIVKTQCPHFKEMRRTCTCVYDEAYIALRKDEK